MYDIGLGLWLGTVGKVWDGYPRTDSTRMVFYGGYSLLSHLS